MNFSYFIIITVTTVYFTVGIASLGRSRRAIQPVIVGGKIAKPHSWPWMVAVFKFVKNSYESSIKFMCGGSLISKNFILSAAHCFGPYRVEDPSKFSIAVGAHTITGGTRYDVESVMIHPNYRWGKHYNDICLIKVREEVALGRNVYPICLPSESLRSRIGNASKSVTVTGWGRTRESEPASKMLREIEVSVVPQSLCKEYYPKSRGKGISEGINQLLICAGVKDAEHGSCHGDSGGPLTMQMEGGDYVQLGIVSFGISCSVKGVPGVYTRVSEYTKWIYDNTDVEKNCTSHVTI